MYCRQCGYNNDNYSRMCKRCGSNLRDVEGAEQRPDSQEDIMKHVGGLKYAPMRVSFRGLIKKRFKKLRHVAGDHKNRLTFVIVIASILLCVAGALIAAQIRSCNTVVVAEYGNNNCNIANNCYAASNERWLFYSVPYGDNTGLYRVDLNTDNKLKVSYHSLYCISLLNDWVYGLDGGGNALRISFDGTRVQWLLEDAPVSSLSVVDNYVYYIGSDAVPYRACLDDVSDERPASPERLYNGAVGSLLACGDWLYYTTLDSVATITKATSVDFGEGYNGEGNVGFVVDELITSPTDAPDTVTMFNSAGYPTGRLYRMRMDGTENTLLVDGAVFAVTVHGDYVYYFTETTVTVSYTDLHPELTEPTKKTKKTSRRRKTTTTEPPPVNVDVPCMQSWRLSLRSMGFTDFLRPDASYSPLNVGGSGVYYISKAGDLMKTGLSGGEGELIATGQQRVDSVSLVGDWVYYTADGGTTFGRVFFDGSAGEILAQAPKS